jgi:myo-inositol 2-dehydrogenase / D-chiro-inositol 1-dehydrogenase
VKLGLGLFGAGRIGAIHAGNAARHARASLRWIVDVDAAAAEALAASHGARASTDPAEVLADPEVGAVVIASATPTHVDLAIAAARAGKAIFCEKPIDLELARVDACLEELGRARVPFLLGFNRRFDPSFAALERSVRAGEVGRVEQVIVTSRDPAPPALAYLKISGGLFRDMMIHDFDMARFLLGEEPVEVFAWGSALVHPDIAAAGDIDTAAVTLRTASGALCQITNSRRAAYGYDQRVEVFGEGGMLQAGNAFPTTVVRSTAAGTHADKPHHFFLERYAAAYRLEMDHFVTSVLDRTPLAVTARDGRAALVLADAALASLTSGQPVRLP